MFDLDNTLYNETDYLFAAYAQIAQKAAAGDKDLEEEYRCYLCHTFSTEGRHLLFQRFISRYQLRVTTDEMLAILRHTTCRLELFPSVAIILSELLKRKKDVAILTNGNPEQQRQKVSNLGIVSRWPQIRILYANETEQKPSPKAMLQLISEYGVQAGDTVLIGDSDIDKQTAINAKTDYIESCYLIN